MNQQRFIQQTMKVQMYCQICSNSFDQSTRRPMMLCMNQHIICEECLKNLLQSRCPFCKQYFSIGQIKPFRLILDKLEQNQLNKNEQNNVSSHKIRKARDINEVLLSSNEIRQEEIEQSHLNQCCIHKCRCSSCFDSLLHCLRWILTTGELYLMIGLGGLIIFITQIVLMANDQNHPTALLIQAFIGLGVSLIICFILGLGKDRIIWRICRRLRS